jgi:NAD(P)-dependent dehydrogenase (short-subunit alcohol dehydrogenase family)
MTLGDRVVLITGATGPAGRAVAARCAEAGSRIGLAGTDAGRLEAVARELGLDDDRWTPAVGDLRRRDAARSIAASVEERFGPIDVLVHAVGGWVGGTSVVDLDPDEVRGMLDQHVWTTLHMAQAVVPGMVERGWGRIVAVTSAVALDPVARQASYALAKAAEEALVRTLAREVGAAGVTANLLAVRTIDAEHAREREPSPKNASWTTPEELAASIVFLCSDEAAAINGARIQLHGRA